MIDVLRAESIPNHAVMHCSAGRDEFDFCRRDYRLAQSAELARRRQ